MRDTTTTAPPLAWSRAFPATSTQVDNEPYGRDPGRRRSWRDSHLVTEASSALVSS